MTSEDKKSLDSIVELNNDVEMLLKKCQSNPERAIKYAERILEIDPYNATAKSIMSRKNNSYSSNGCYVATAVYGSYDCPQVWTLRRFRDNTLSKRWYGRLFIHTYYAISPFGSTEWFTNLFRPTLDRMVKHLNSKGVKDTPYNDRHW